MQAEVQKTGDLNIESSRCVVCFEPIHPQAKTCPQCQSPQKPKWWQNVGLVLKWLGGATAVISLVAGTLQLNELLRASRERNAAIENLVGAAELQMDGGDLDGAIIMLQQAVEIDPSNSKARILRARIAADKVRKYYGFSGHNHREQIDPLIPVLFRGAASTDAVTSADMLAHIGWANHLRSKNSNIRRPVKYYFERALERDPGNVFAHIFWANWCLSNSGQPDCGDNLQTAIKHYTSARKSGREQEYLNDIYSFTLAATMVEGAGFYLVSEVAKQLSEGRSPDEDIRSDISGELFRLTQTDEDLRDLCSRLSPRDVLALAEWALDPDLTERDGWTDAAIIGFLQEEVGDTEKALETYRAVRLMMRQEEMGGQRAFTERRARIDLRLAKLLDVRPPSLGIRQEDVNDELAQALGMQESRGTFVAEVIDGGPAHQAGVERGDVIFSIDGNEIKSSWRNVLDELHAPKVGDEVDLLIFRDGQERTVRVQLGEKELGDLQSSQSFWDTHTAFARLLDKVLYNTQVMEFANGELVLVNLRADIRKAFKIKDVEDGVLVFSNWGARMQLRSGDLIKEVEGQTVKNVAELQTALTHLSDEGHSSVLIKILTYGRDETRPVMLRNR